MSKRLQFLFTALSFFGHGGFAPNSNWSNFVTQINVESLQHPAKMFNRPRTFY